jgi:predicted ATPase
MLKSIRFSNFKSISSEPVSLGNLNVLIGANAAGKSNFVDGLRFLHSAQDNGVSSAIGRRFGWDNVLTRGKDKRTDKITTEIICDFKEPEQEFKVGKKTYKPVGCEYELELGYYAGRTYVNLETLKTRLVQDGTEVTEGFNRTKRKVQIQRMGGIGERQKPFTVPRHLEDKLFLQGGFFGLGPMLLADFINRWRFYDLDVQAARRSCLDEGQSILLDDGHNLAVILDKLRRDSSSRAIRDRILNLMSHLIPGFERWRPAHQYDGSLGYKISEKGMARAFLPEMVSDGTIRLLSILLALLYQPAKAALICLDEPERYLHPQVLKPLAEIMREVSGRTQVIVTTHSTELVKWLKPNEVLMVDKINNVTHIVRAQSISMVDKFLEEFSLDELWLSGYLKGGKIL